MDKRKVGRPKVTQEEHTKAITITVTPRTLELIDIAAENASVSRSKMIERLCCAVLDLASKQYWGVI